MKIKQEAAQQLLKYMMLAQKETQDEDGDREKNWTELSEQLDGDAIEELKENLYYLSIGHESVRKNTLLKCGAMANVVVAIIDKLSNEEA